MALIGFWLRLLVAFGHLVAFGFWWLWLLVAFGFWWLLAFGGFGFRCLLAFGGFWLLVTFGFCSFCWLFVASLTDMDDIF